MPRKLSEKTLQQQFDYYLNRYKRRLVEERAFNIAMGYDFNQPEMFSNLNYNSIFEKGLTRKRGTKTVRIKGEEAVKVQIMSLKRRASLVEMKNAFINNYVSAYLQAGGRNPGRLRSLLRGVTSRRLAFLIKIGAIPDIQFFYAHKHDFDEEQFFKDLIGALNSKTYAKAYERARLVYKEILPVQRKMSEIVGKYKI